MDEAIGGYFSLEVNGDGQEYHNGLYRLNSARNAIAYVASKRKYKRVFVSKYTCGVVIDVLKNNGVKVEYYDINQHLELETIPELESEEALLYINYFGLKDDHISQLSKQINNLIIDNAQAFYSTPLANVDTVYSPRKFFGLPDGGYLSSTVKEDIDLPKDVSINRFSHLIKRLDLGAERGYKDFKENDTSLEGEPIKEMSSLTQSILNNINYQFAKKTRNDNYNFLHDNLSSINTLQIKFDTNKSPMVYPLLIEDVGLRKELSQNKVFIATYWPDVTSRCANDSLESYFANYILPLPIDQRYSIEEMKKIASILLK